MFRFESLGDRTDSHYNFEVAQSLTFLKRKLTNKWKILLKFPIQRAAEVLMKTDIPIK